METESSDDFLDFIDGKAAMSTESDKQINSPMSLEDDFNPEISDEIIKSPMSLEDQSNPAISEEDEPEPTIKMLMYKRMTSSEDESSSPDNESDETEVEFDNEDDIEF